MNTESSNLLNPFLKKSIYSFMTSVYLDHLFPSKWTSTSSFLLILEVKNMAGEIFKCSAFTMERKLKKWICRTCLDISLDAHISAIYDYLYLVKPTITNSEFRNFVQLQSPSSAKKLLLSLKLNLSGHTRG